MQRTVYSTCIDVLYSAAYCACRDVQCSIQCIVHIELYSAGYTVQCMYRYTVQDRVCSACRDVQCRIQCTVNLLMSSAEYSVQFV